jgi:hypothetical protein
MLVQIGRRLFFVPLECHRRSLGRPHAVRPGSYYINRLIIQQPSKPLELKASFL